jgi:hypothetical protein
MKREDSLFKNSATSTCALCACSVFFFCNSFNRLEANRKFDFSLGYWVPQDTDIIVA